MTFHESENEEIQRLIDIVGFCARTASNIKERMRSDDESAMDSVHNLEEITAIEMLLLYAVDIVETNAHIAGNAA